MTKNPQTPEIKNSKVETPKKRALKPETGWPESFALDEAMRAFAASHGIDADAEFEAWRDDCAAHGRRYHDWQAAWRTRIRNTQRFGGARNLPTVAPAKPSGPVVRPAIARLLNLAEELKAQGR